MLMPISTARTAVAGKPANDEKMPVAEPKATVAPRISGVQSDAMLRILQTLNRHLVDAGPQPRDALIRLLDTLAKVLKIPPLPQESLRDFTRRLASFMETLPPASRYAVEKLLAQRSLAASLRILIDSVSGPIGQGAQKQPDPRQLPLPLPAGSDPKATPQPLRLPSAPVAPQAAAMPQPVTQQVPQSSPGIPLLPPMQTVPNVQHGNPALTVAPAQLQAALKAAFADEDMEPVSPEDVPERQVQETKDVRPRSINTAAPTLSPPGLASALANSPVPTLRAAIAFLAANPEALARILLMTAGDIDSGVLEAIREELGFDPLEEPRRQGTAQQPKPAPTLQTLPVMTVDAPEAAAPAPWQGVEDTKTSVQGNPAPTAKPGAEGLSAFTASSLSPVEPDGEKPVSLPASVEVDEGATWRETEIPRRLPALEATASQRQMPEPPRMMVEPDGFDASSEAPALQRELSPPRDQQEPAKQPSAQGGSQRDIGSDRHGRLPQRLEAPEAAEMPRLKADPEDFEAAVAQVLNADPRQPLREGNADLPTKALVQVLKALLALTLPPSEQTLHPQALLNVFTDGAADSEAAAILSAITPEEEQPQRSHAGLATATTVETEAHAVERDITGNGERPMPAAMPADDRDGVAQPRAFEAGMIARDGFPLAMVPYAASGGNLRARAVDEDEDPAFGQEPGDDQPAGDDAQDGNEAGGNAPAKEEPDETDEQPVDGYALYGRLGGFA